MKIKLMTFLVAGSLAYATAYAQTNTFPASGNVGIGTTSPVTRLNVHGNQLTNRISQSGATYTELAQKTWGGSAAILFSAYASPTYVDGSLSATGATKYRFGPSVFGVNSHGAKMLYADHSNIGFFISPASTGADNNVSWGTPIMWLRRDGNVGIGTINPNARLAVNGNIRAKEVKVETANWPDYVFQPDYDLLPLDELSAYIKEYGHLPDIPKAEAVEKEGVDLGEMNRLLLKKVEELTLHLIEMKTELTSQSTEILMLKQSINSNP